MATATETPLIDRLEKLHKAATPGEWERESRDTRVRDGAYEAVHADGKSLFDTANSEAMELHEEYDDGLVTYWDETGRKNFEFCVAAHNEFPALAEQHREMLRVLQYINEDHAAITRLPEHIHDMLEDVIEKVTGRPANEGGAA